MDTKSRNIRYSKAMKICAVLLVWVTTMVCAGCGIYFLYNQEVITSNNYFETDSFISEYSRYIHNVVEYYIKPESEETSQSYANDGYMEYNYRTNIIKNRLSKAVNFAYYITDNKKSTITNVTDSNAISLLQDQSTYVLFNDSEMYYNYRLYYTSDIMQAMSNTPYEVHTAVIEPLKKGDLFYENYYQYMKIKSQLPLVTLSLVISIILLVVSFIYLITVTGRREKYGEIAIVFPDKIYTDVHTLLVLALAVMSFGAGIQTISGEAFLYSLISTGIIFSIDIFIGLCYLLSMVRQYKRGVLIKNSLISRTISKVQTVLISISGCKTIKPITLLLVLGYGLTNGILLSMVFSLLNHDTAGFLVSSFVTITFNVVAIYYTSKYLVSLSKIVKAANEISSGNLDYSLEKASISTIFINFANDIQNIQSGLKKAVADAVKGERMKTALITNVSHDLKTPLTSIINYVGLLKKEEINNENAVNYINVLDEKSEKLKQLIEDLIEASKASSGNISVNSEKVDLKELITQACGEYEEKINKTGLDIRINSIDKEVPVSVDGKHMWRIVENLMSNVIKYTLTGSRVYINISSEDKYGILVIKNISKLPLEISPEQLTQRFVRGDESRTTEGSGLGLSIAQSLTEVQNGKFEIQIDGDLFKVIIKMPLWYEKVQV